MKKLILAAALPALLAGCYVHGSGAVAYETNPPPPRYVVVENRPGHVWVDGYWYWHHNDWAWRNGYYVIDRPGYVYVQGRYHGRHYRPGHWRARSYYAPNGNSQAGRAVRSGLRDTGSSRARQYTSPNSRSYQQPARSSQPSRSRGSDAGRAVRDHRR